MRNDIEIAIDILFMQNKIKSNDLAGFLNDWKINSKKFMVFDAHGKYVVNPDLDFIYKYAIGGLIFDATKDSHQKKSEKHLQENLIQN